MHETAIVAQLIATAEQHVARCGLTGRVHRLKLDIGKLSGFSPDAVRFAFDLLSSGTPLQGAALEIEEPAATAACATCGTTAPAGDVFAVCAACGSPDVSIQGGRDLLLQSIEIEDG